MSEWSLKQSLILQWISKTMWLYLSVSRPWVERGMIWSVILMVCTMQGCDWKPSGPEAINLHAGPVKCFALPPGYERPEFKELSSLTLYMSSIDKNKNEFWLEIDERGEISPGLHHLKWGKPHATGWLEGADSRKWTVCSYDYDVVSAVLETDQYSVAMMGTKGAIEHVVRSMEFRTATDSDKSE